jgi:hypothetical protein
MLANKRTSWVRRSSQQNHHNAGFGNPSSEEEHKMEIIPPHFASSSTSGTLNQQKKEHITTGKVELIDLLRPVPLKEDKASSTSTRLSELEHEE